MTSAPNPTPCPTPSPKTLGVQLSEILSMTTAFQDGNRHGSASPETPAESSRPSSPSASPVPWNDMWTDPTFLSSVTLEYFYSQGFDRNSIEDFLQSPEQRIRDEAEVKMMANQILMHEKAAELQAELKILIELRNKRNKQEEDLEELEKKVGEMEKEVEEAIKEVDEAEKGFEAEEVIKEVEEVFYRRHSR